MSARALLAAALGAAVILSAPPSGAQEIDPLFKLGANNRFQFELILDSARMAGLPTRPLHSKALEGINKGADGRHIVAVVRSLYGSLREARAVLGPVGETELAAAAAVLEAGVRPEQLSPFSNPARDRPLASAFVVLADLVTRGVPRDEASSAIARLWQGGAADADFYGLWKGVEEDILSGLNPGTALQNRMREMPGRVGSSGRPAP